MSSLMRSTSRSSEKNYSKTLENMSINLKKILKVLTEKGAANLCTSAVLTAVSAFLFVCLSNMLGLIGYL